MRLSVDDQRRKVVSAVINHDHVFKIMATRISSGRTQLEFQAMGTPRYIFRCACGEIEWMTLDDAIQRGWIDLLVVGKEER